MHVVTRRPFSHTLLMLFVSAALLRGAWIVALACQHDAQAVLHMSPDTSRYVAIADHLLGRCYSGPPLHDLGRPAYGTGEGALAWSGPGYGVFLAGIRAVSGDTPWPVLIIQVLLSALNCVLVALLAYVLLGSRRVALVAGVIGIFSLTSITLSGAVLTETPMVTLFTASLLCFVVGLRDGSWRWFLAAGGLVGLSCLVRQVLQFWPIMMVMVVLVIPASGLGLPRRHIVMRTIVSGMVAVACMAAWMERNHAVHDTRFLSHVGFISARFWLGARAMAGLDQETSTNDIRRRWLDAEAVIDGPEGAQLRAYQQRDRAEFIRTCRAYPWVVTKRFIKNVIENMTIGDELHQAQLPWTQPLLAPVVDRRTGALIAGIVLVSAVGLLVRARNRAAGIVLAATYAYMLGLSGFGCWQGSRYVFSAHMAWTILVAWGVCTALAFVLRVTAGVRSGTPAAWTDPAGS